MIDVLTFYGRAPEDKHDDIVMITLYQLNTNANALVSNMAAPDALLRGHRYEPATGPLGANISASRFKLHFRSSEIWFKAEAHYLSNGLSAWMS